MKKIPTVFDRDWAGNRQILDEVAPGCEWVLRGEGIPTEKMDGMATLVKDGRLYKRYELKKGKSAPSGFEPAQEPDHLTGETPGWVPVGVGPEDKYFRMGLVNSGRLADGTYELLGPKVQSNKYKMGDYILERHGVRVLEDCERTFRGLQHFLLTHEIEGIVWHHPDGRMAKLKRRDFGFQW